jgi:hypothetical protein
MSLTSLILILQTSLAPCVLISAVGLLLLSMTNRIGRPIDRIRALTNDLKQSDSSQKKVLLEEIDILFRRAKILQYAVSFAVLSIFLSVTIIYSLFVMATYGLDLMGVTEVLYSAGLVSLVISLAIFLWDIQLGLNSIRVEIERWTSALAS